MPEYSDYTPAPWSNDSFTDARATYDSHVGRSYDDAKTRGVKATDLVPAKMTTNAKRPIVILTDETGSMGDWPATIFSKLGYLDHEAKFYFGDDYAICFGAFGDAGKHEDYALQMRPFATGAELQERLKELVIEAKGGGNVIESSELGALYVDRNIETPNADRPILIIITDEKCYGTVNTDEAKQWAKVDLKERLSAKALFESLQQKWSVYLIRKPYHDQTEGAAEPSTNREVRLSWENYLGEDHIAFLPDANRVVDVIFGIFAEEADKVIEFRQELNDRQLKDKGGDVKVATVLKALGTIHTEDGEPKKLAGPSLKKLAAPRDKSITRRTPGDKSIRSKSLLGDDDDDK